MEDQAHQEVEQTDINSHQSISTDINQDQQPPHNVESETTQTTKQQAAATSHQSDATKNKLITVGGRVSPEHHKKFYDIRAVLNLDPTPFMEHLIDLAASPPPPEVKVETKEVPISLKENQFILELSEREMKFLGAIQSNRISYALNSGKEDLINQVNQETPASIIK